MYVKYLMAKFFVVFAMSMLAQFTSYFLNALAIMNGDACNDDAETGEQKALRNLSFCYFVFNHDGRWGQVSRPLFAGAAIVTITLLVSAAISLPAIAALILSRWAD